jgi:hypothetical protein
MSLSKFVSLAVAIALALALVLQVAGRHGAQGSPLNAKKKYADTHTHTHTQKKNRTFLLLLAVRPSSQKSHTMLSHMKQETHEAQDHPVR